MRAVDGMRVAGRLYPQLAGAKISPERADSRCDPKRKSSIPFCCGATKSPLSIKEWPFTAQAQQPERLIGEDRPFRALISAEIRIQEPNEEESTHGDRPDLFL
jgi:hypothetical protein